MSPADSASRAGGMPEASGDSSSGTFADYMSLRSRRLSEGMKPGVEGAVYAPDRKARVRVRAGRLACTHRRCNGTRLRVNLGPAMEAQQGSTVPRAQYITHDRARQARTRPPAAWKGSRRNQVRRPARMNQQCEQTSRGNPYRQALLVLKHEACLPSGAPHWRRSLTICQKP